MAIEDFKGYASRTLNMPDGGKIICFFYRNNAAPTSVEDGNRNVFRLAKDGKVLWQVTRIDHPETNWVAKHKHARERGEPGCVEPFIRFYLAYPDETTNQGGQTNTLPDEADWVSGCRVELSALGLGSLWYSLDVETGVATEITPMGARPW